MTYLKNSWYMIAWSADVADGLLARTALDVPLVLFRRPGDGGLVALHDRCPHRFAPLSRGHLAGDHIRCGYHGLEFDSAGQCRASYFSNAVPAAARVRSFPIAERDNAIWVWMGDPERADPALVPHLPFQADPGMRVVFGHTVARANYQLYNDNLLDLTHATFLHTTIGGPEWRPRFRSWEEDGGVCCDYVVEDMAGLHGAEARVKARDIIKWKAPGTHVLTIDHTPLDDASLPFFLISAHVLTPETEGSTHYFWSGAIDSAMPIEEPQMRAILTTAFDLEDKPMIEAIQQRMGGAEFWSLDPILLGADAGSVRARRILQRLINEEAASAEAAIARSPAESLTELCGAD